MLQYSKVLEGREKWKEKAIKRGEQVRQYKKNTKQYKSRITELEEMVATLKQESKKN